MEIPFWLPKIEILAKISFKGKAIVSLPLSPCASSWWFRSLWVLTSFSSKDSCLCDSRLLQRCPHAIWKRVNLVYFLFSLTWIGNLVQNFENLDSDTSVFPANYSYSSRIPRFSRVSPKIASAIGERQMFPEIWIFANKNSWIYRGIQTGHSACRHSSGKRY